MSRSYAWWSMFYNEFEEYHDPVPGYTFITNYGESIVFTEEILTEKSVRQHAAAFARCREEDVLVLRNDRPAVKWQTYRKNSDT